MGESLVETQARGESTGRSDRMCSRRTEGAVTTGLERRKEQALCKGLEAGELGLCCQETWCPMEAAVISPLTRPPWSALSHIPPRGPQSPTVEQREAGSLKNDLQGKISLEGHQLSQIG